MLCDEVGLGKTYVALALAREFPRCLVVLPAALTSMWQSALTGTGIHASLNTFEALSRADLADRKTPQTARKQYDLVIVDEAHHVRNPHTNRYLALESLVRGARVLLLSATPIHNRREDLVALLSLFLGSRADALTSAELALCVVRREQKQLGQPLAIPVVRPAVYHQLPDDAALVQRLMTLPPPLPVRDGGFAGALIGRGLVHQWASSEAALREAMRRRIARASALCAALEAGTYPTARELETWAYADGALQLGFAQLLAAPVGEHQTLLTAIQSHLAALESINTGLVSVGAIDDERARVISTITGRDPGARVVAFAQYSETVSMLFRKLAHSGRVAMLTSHGARVAGGSLTRLEAISRFAPLATGAREPSPAEAIDLLLTTDILSEGVNLQDAGIVIHLDIPWTSARMEQRVGRAARLGSRHSAVLVHVLRPPHSAAQAIASEAIIQRKWASAKRAIGTSVPMPGYQSASQPTAPQEVETASAPANAERLRAILEGWIFPRTADDSPHFNFSENSIAVATVFGSQPGFVAAIRTAAANQLLVCVSDRVTTDLGTQLERCSDTGLAEDATDDSEVARVIGMIREWSVTTRAAVAAGLGESNAQRRKALTSRIDASIATAPPHLRASRLTTAARARAVTTLPQCAAVERELEVLLRSDLATDAWLAAVADLDTRQASVHPQTALHVSLQIHAVLVVRVRPRRSRSRRARESP
jgi:hypothetical protein